METVRRSVALAENNPVKVIPTKKVSTGFLVASTSTTPTTDKKPLEKGLKHFLIYFVDFLSNFVCMVETYFPLETAVDETSRQLGFLRTPGATPRSSSPAEHEVTPFSTPKSQTGYNS